MPSLPSRVFTNGNSQAVRIPREFRLDTQRVEISRTSEGDLLIRPVSDRRGAALLEVLNRFDDAVGAEFVAELERERTEAAPPQERGACRSSPTPRC